MTKKQQLYSAWMSGSITNASQTFAELGLDERAGRRYLALFKQQDAPAVAPQVNCDRCLDKERLEKTITELKKEVAFYKEDRLTTEDVKKYILELKQSDPQPPSWILSPPTARATVIPSIMLSDIHDGEVVYPEQIFESNKYSLDICATRIERLCANMLELLKVHINAEYPGVVVCLNGDLVSGDIHDELTATNEAPIMPAVIHLWGVLKEFFQTLVDEFDNVEVYATAGGNHGRTTRKVPSKNKAYTNFDWLICRFLQAHFQDDSRIRFNISDGDDIQFKIFDHRYRMTHGDQFRGGQGFVGPFAPITRNDKKKRTAADSYGMGYDTLLIGHFHTLMFLPSVITNGSVIGYSEYAMRSNFEFEVPQQALWLTHHDRGITGRYPVFCD